MEMSKKVLKQLCREKELYGTPELNDVLYLHYKGFKKIDNLDEYTSVKVLWLEGNGFAKIEGLENQPSLKHLYLQENYISKIENLEKLIELDTLNLSQNVIRKIEGLSHLQNLNSLILKRNRLKTKSDLEGLLECKSLVVLDLSQNKIEDQSVMEVFEQMPNLKVLYLKGNPFVQKIPQYRRRTIASLSSLTYLDERPVFPDERKRSEAWAKGGKVAEKAEIQRQIKEKKEKEDRQFRAFQKLVDDSKKIYPVDDEESAENDENVADSNIASSDQKDTSKTCVESENLTKLEDNSTDVAAGIEGSNEKSIEIEQKKIP
uniref:Dynein axonemal assembly factor 1 homolog n=1 Tax=Hirondellea gigas TaxID=1518452 RepID=A0A6A7G7U1_9CRUS